MYEKTDLLEKIEKDIKYGSKEKLVKAEISQNNGERKQIKKDCKEYFEKEKIQILIEKISKEEYLKIIKFVVKSNILTIL